MTKTITSSCQKIGGFYRRVNDGACTLCLSVCLQRVVMLTLFYAAAAAAAIVCYLPLHQAPPPLLLLLLQHEELMTRQKLVGMTKTTLEKSSNRPSDSQSVVTIVCLGQLGESRDGPLGRSKNTGAISAYLYPTDRPIRCGNHGVQLPVRIVDVKCKVPKNKRYELMLIRRATALV